MNHALHRSSNPPVLLGCATCCMRRVKEEKNTTIEVRITVVSQQLSSDRESILDVGRRGDGWIRATSTCNFGWLLDALVEHTSCSNEQW